LYDLKFEKKNTYFRSAALAEERLFTLSLDDSTETFPHYFIADEAFPLKINIIRPYARRMLTNERHILITDSLVPEKL
jgi:hypothetical protein